MALDSSLMKEYLRWRIAVSSILRKIIDASQTPMKKTAGKESRLQEINPHKLNISSFHNWLPDKWTGPYPTFLVGEVILDITPEPFFLIDTAQDRAAYCAVANGKTWVKAKGVWRVSLKGVEIFESHGWLGCLYPSSTSDICYLTRDGESEALVIRTLFKVRKYERLQIT